MAYLEIDQSKLTEEIIGRLVEICPFSALEYKGGALVASDECRLCGQCCPESSGAIRLIDEEAPKKPKEGHWGICVFIEAYGKGMHPVGLELIGKALELKKKSGEPVITAAIGDKALEASKTALKYGVDKAYSYDSPLLRQPSMGLYAAILESFVEMAKPSSMLFGATNFARGLAPMLAVKLQTGLTADCTALEMAENGELSQIRPAFGGNIMAHILTPSSRPQMCTVRYKVFPAPKEAKGGGEVIECDAGPYLSGGRARVTNIEEKPAEIDISEAKAIVAVGRGLKGKDALSKAKELSDLLGAQMACTRPLIESGLFGPKRQIGLSGRSVAADLIITLGISGAIQFIAGMQQSKYIIAVNTDPSAPIFSVAHFSAVGDAAEVCSALIEKIKNNRQATI